MVFDFFPWKKNDEDFKKIKELFALKQYENSAIFNFGIEFQEELAKDNTKVYIDLVFNGGKYPDAILYNEATSETVRIEFESCSSHFKLHKHDPLNCDLIVCSINDWNKMYPKEKCPIPIYVIESKKLN